MSVESISHVLRHSRAKGTQKLVLVGIANHDGDGGAWPSIETLMTYANADRRTVQRAIAALVDLGELVVHEQDGGTRNTRNDRRPNRYTITVAHGAAQTPPRDVNGAASMTARGGAGVAHGAAQTPPEPSSNHPEPSSNSSVAPFVAFWDAYPRRTGKAAARKAFLKATTKVRADLIVRAAERMATDPNLPEEGFIPHPATWLNQERWDDPPYPPRAGHGPTTATRVGQAMDVARRMAEQDRRALGVAQ